MIKGTIRYYDETAIAIAIGTSEDVKAPRGLALLEKAGWPIDQNTTVAYKAWLAGKRQGDIPADSKFEDWSDTVAEVDLKPTAKQIEELVISGVMTREQGDYALAQIGSDSGE